MGGSFDRWVARVKAIHDATVKTETLEKDAKGNLVKSDASPDADYYETMFISNLGDVFEALGYDARRFDINTIPYDDDLLMHDLLSVYAMSEGTHFTYAKHTLGHGKVKADTLLERTRSAIKSRFGWDMNEGALSQLYEEVTLLKAIRADADRAAEALRLPRVCQPPLAVLEVKLRDMQQSVGRSTDRVLH